MVENTRHQTPNTGKTPNIKLRAEVTGIEEKSNGAGRNKPKVIATGVEAAGYAGQFVLRSGASAPQLQGR